MNMADKMIYSIEFDLESDLESEINKLLRMEIQYGR